MSADDLERRANASLQVWANAQRDVEGLVDDILGRLKAVEQENAHLRSTNSSLENQLPTLRATNSSLQAERDALLTSKSHLTNEVTSLLSSVKSASSLIELSMEKNRQLVEDKRALQALGRELAEEREVLVEQVERLIQDRQASMGEQKALAKELAEVKARNEVMEVYLRDSEAREATLEDEIRGVREKLHALQIEQVASSSTRVQHPPPIATNHPADEASVEDVKSALHKLQTTHALLLSRKAAAEHKFFSYYTEWSDFKAWWGAFREFPGVVGRVVAFNRGLVERHGTTERKLKGRVKQVGKQVEEELKEARKEERKPATKAAQSGDPRSLKGPRLASILESPEPRSAKLASRLLEGSSRVARVNEPSGPFKVNDQNPPATSFYPVQSPNSTRPTRRPESVQGGDRTRPDSHIEPIHEPRAVQRDEDCEREKEIEEEEKPLETQLHDDRVELETQLQEAWNVLGNLDNEIERAPLMVNAAQVSREPGQPPVVLRSRSAPPSQKSTHSRAQSPGSRLSQDFRPSQTSRPSPCSRQENFDPEKTQETTPGRTQKGFSQFRFDWSGLRSPGLGLYSPPTTHKPLTPQQSPINIKDEPQDIHLFLTASDPVSSGVKAKSKASPQEKDGAYPLEYDENENPFISCALNPNPEGQHSETSDRGRIGSKRERDQGSKPASPKGDVLNIKSDVEHVVALDPSTEAVPARSAAVLGGKRKALMDDEIGKVSPRGVQASLSSNNVRQEASTSTTRPAPVYPRRRKSPNAQSNVYLPGSLVPMRLQNVDGSDIRTEEGLRSKKRKGEDRCVFVGGKERATNVNAQYEIDPDQNGGLNFAFDEVVRRKDERRKLNAGTCDCCHDYYEAVGYLPPRLQAPLWRSPKAGEKKASYRCRNHGGDARTHEDEKGDESQGDDRLEAVRAHQQAISRHRHQWARAATPPAYWSMGFPTTQEVREINERAEEMHAEKLRSVAKEAEKGGNFRKK